MFRKSSLIIARELGMSFSKIRARKLCYVPIKCLDLTNKHFLQAVPQVHFQSRDYAKGKDIKKSKKKKIQIDEIELGELFDVEKLYSDLSKPINDYKEELMLQASVRTSIGAIENIKIQFEGENYILQDLAEISKKNPKMYVLDFTAFPQALPEVKSVLDKSELNLNAQQDGVRIFVPIPKVTKEHREVLAKKSKALFIKCKDSIRDVQNKYLRKLNNINSLSEELRFRVTDQLIELGNRNISSAEEILKQKQDELLKTD